MTSDYFFTLRHEMLAGLITTKDEFEQRLLELESARWPDRKQVTRGRLVKFMEHCFEYARTPYHRRYQTGIRLLGMLFQWAPGIVDLMRRTGEYAIANMLLSEGQTHFRIPDRFALTVFLQDWEKLGFARISAEQLYLTTISKPRVHKRILEDDLPTLARLRAVFPEIVETEWSASKLVLADDADDSAEFVAQGIQEDMDDGASIAAQIVACNELSPAYRPVQRPVEQRYCRNQKLVALLKAFHADKCQWCGLVIRTASGQRYSEVHHVISLGSGGADRCENMVVLCPNHHVQMHYCLLASPCIQGDTWQIIATEGPVTITANLLGHSEETGEGE
jgi:hypothetical protein